jgi:hypothetical protein
LRHVRRKRTPNDTPNSSQHNKGADPPSLTATVHCSFRKVSRHSKYDGIVRPRRSSTLRGSLSCKPEKGKMAKKGQHPEKKRFSCMGRGLPISS